MTANFVGIYTKCLNEITLRRAFYGRRDCMQSTIYLEFEKSREVRCYVHDCKRTEFNHLVCFFNFKKMIIKHTQNTGTIDVVYHTEAHRVRSGRRLPQTAAVHRRPHLGETLQVSLSNLLLSDYYHLNLVRFISLCCLCFLFAVRCI